MHHLRGLKELLSYILRSGSTQTVVGELLGERGFVLLFEDFQHVDRYIRKTAARIVYELGRNAIENLEYICQQNGLSVGKVSGQMAKFVTQQDLRFDCSAFQSECK